MAERDELIRRNGPAKSYGSVPKYDDEDEEDQKPVRCLCTRRDCILVSVLSIIIAVAIITSLAIGIPAIEEKQRINSLNDLPVPSPKILPSVATQKTEVTTPRWNEIETTQAVTPNSPAALSQENVTAAPATATNQSTPAKLVYKRAAVAADDPRCADIGSYILGLNGTAVDAAISTLLCLEAVNPQHSGIGGGFFMMVYSRKANKTYALDARETAPANASVDMFNGNISLSLTGGLSIAVPGTVQGYLEAHTRFGGLPWKDLFTPTINLCRDGFKIYKGLEDALLSERESILEQPTLRELLVNNATGDVYKENDTLYRTVFADTLQKLANQGARYFYEGPMAEQLIGEIQKAGGILSLTDLRNYTVRVKEALRVKVSDDLRLHTMPPPSSGPLLGFILNVLINDTLPSPPSDLSNVSAVTLTQRFVESLKFAYALRSQIGDEDFVNMTALIQNITSKTLAESIRKMIYDNATFDPSYYLDSIRNPSVDRGTSHVTVFSENGDVVSVTSTVNQRFGSKIRSRSLDIILNDEMNDFSFPNDKRFGDPSSSPNLVAPGKRPLSTMTPAIFFDSNGTPTLGIGGAGGIAILSSVADVLFKHMILNRSLEDSISTPRVHHQLIPNILHMEPEFSREFVDAFRNIGHNVSLEVPITHVNGVLRLPDGSIIAASDPRMSSGISGF